MLDGVFPPFFRLLSHGCPSSIKGADHALYRIALMNDTFG